MSVVFIQTIEMHSINIRSQKHCRDSYHECSPTVFKRVGRQEGTGAAAAAGVGEEPQTGATDPEKPGTGEHCPAQSTEENPRVRTGGFGNGIKFYMHTSVVYFKGVCTDYLILILFF